MLFFFSVGHCTPLPIPFCPTVQRTERKVLMLWYLHVVEWDSHEPYCFSCPVLEVTPSLLFHHAAKAYGRSPAWSDRTSPYLFQIKSVNNPSVGDSSVEHVRHGSGNANISLKIGMLGALCLRTLRSQLQGRSQSNEYLANTNQTPDPFVLSCSCIFKRDKNDIGWVGGGRIW